MHIVGIALSRSDDPQRVVASREQKAQRLVYSLGIAKFDPKASLVLLDRGPPPVYEPPQIEGGQVVLSVGFEVPAIAVLDYVVEPAE